MLKFNVEQLVSQDGEQVKNTWFRSPKVSPNIIKKDNKFIVRTVEDEVIITRLEEVILYIIVIFKFAPFWLVQRWYDETKDEVGLASKEINRWINVGLIWVETSSTGVYLRPTKFLLDIFHEKTNYIDIPYNTLTHTISEAQVMFDLMIGNESSEMWQIIKKENTLPCFHPLLEPDENETGTIIIRENEFRTNFRAFNKEQLLMNERIIEEQIKAGVSFTEEFSDFKLFPIVVFNKDINAKGEIFTQNPDLIVPIPRIEGSPKSYAIEVEISSKMPERYDVIMNSYKNNNKFGKVFYLCGNQRIGRLIKEAFNRVGGLGSCELFILPFTPPSQDIENFSIAAQKLQMELIKNSVKNYI